MFTKKNRQQIKSHGLSEAEILCQLKTFKEGIPSVHLAEAATEYNGIEVLSEQQQNEFVVLFEKNKDNLELLKFVPASGAATRMFGFLYRFLEEYDFETQDIDEFLRNGNHRDLDVFIAEIDKFPCFDWVQQSLQKKYHDFREFNRGKQLYFFVREMLSETGLNLNNTPKGLVPFHKYGKNSVTAFEEQLFEAAFYASSKGIAKLHFTISEEHREIFKNSFEEIRERLEKSTGVKFNILYSFQRQETDTVAATPENELFLDENGNLVFRPSGHGALLQNLNKVDADIVFIKNIDNVVTEKYIETIAFQKKVLAGKLISLQQKIFGFVKKFHKENVPEAILNETAVFISEALHIKNIPINKGAILEILERPVRVCGMVENTGAPGGGPFFVKNKNGTFSLQIVEMAQIETNNPQQKAILDSATHFNPVDLVCGVRNYKGEKYDLTKYTNPDSGFISNKTYNGKPIKALELPGLWNGAMANWNTVFVEVPLATFNPVKTINDLLNNAHQV